MISPKTGFEARTERLNDQGIEAVGFTSYATRNAVQCCRCVTHDLFTLRVHVLRNVIHGIASAAVGRVSAWVFVVWLNGPLAFFAIKSA